MSDPKVCVITGSSSGIGAATALYFAQKGWRVVINYSRKAEPAETVASACRAVGGETLIIKCNVASNDDCLSLAQAVKKTWGRADVLINNAGTTKFVDIKNLDAVNADDFHSIYDVNVIGAYQMVRALTPMLKQNPGAGIVNISSVAGSMGIGSSLAYMASKGALNALTVGLARALGPAIRVNAIAPGLVDTPWLREGLGADRYAATVASYGARAALADVIAPEDVAAAAWFLGVEARKTTGEILLLDAGLRITKA